MEELRQTYLKLLQGLKPIEINEFIEKVKTFKEDKIKYSYFDKIEELIKEFTPIELLKIFQEQEFIKSFYVDSQAKYIKDKLNLSQDLEVFKTLVYCYNSNKRNFEKAEDERILRDKLLKEGFKEQELIKDNEVIDLRFLDGLKVICVLDVSKIGLMGSFDSKEEIKGKLVYSDYQKNLMLIPNKCRTRGHIIRNTFYYKEI